MASTELNNESFAQALREHDMVVVDFWAPWCAPCRQFAPTFEKVAEKHPEILFAKVNTNVFANQELVDRFSIFSIPTITVFRGEKLIFSRSGLLTEAGLEQIVEKTASIEMDELRAEMDLLASRH